MAPPPEEVLVKSHPRLDYLLRLQRRTVRFCTKLDTQWKSLHLFKDPLRSSFDLFQRVPSGLLNSESEKALLTRYIQRIWLWCLHALVQTDKAKAKYRKR